MLVVLENKPNNAATFLLFKILKGAKRGANMVDISLDIAGSVLR